MLQEVASVEKIILVIGSQWVNKESSDFAYHYMLQLTPSSKKRILIIGSEWINKQS